jgi:serine/threonine protein kinase
MTEYLERIGQGYRHDLWMVRLANPGGGFGQAQIYDGSDRDWEGAVERETTPWLSFSHERVIPVLSVASTANRLVIVHGDERGPSIHGMAGLLRDTSERTHWSVEQIAGVAEAIAMMAWRQHGFVHRRANHEQIVVGVDGTARLRAPVAFVAWGKPGTYTGRGNSMGKSIRYLSPEQIRGEPPTAASDVHTLGGTLYKALTGRAPFGEGGTELDTMNAIHTGVTPPTPTDVPPALAALVMNFSVSCINCSTLKHSPLIFSFPLISAIIGKRESLGIEKAFERAFARVLRLCPNAALTTLKSFSSSETKGFL